MWVLALLTVMAVALTAAQRTETALTSNHLEAARFRALADAAIAYTALDFMTQSPASEEGTEGTWLPNGVPKTWYFAGTGLSIAVFNEMSRIDLNEASLELLTELLLVLEVPEEEAAKLAAAIADWRDEDDLVLLQGVEDDAYAEAGRSLGAKDAPFEAVEELQQVFGMTPEIYQRLAAEVTVQGEGGAPAEEFATPAVLAALKGISLEAAELEVAERDAPALADSEAARTVDRGGPLYRVQVTARSGDGSNRRMEALVEVTPGQQPPYLVYWRRLGLMIREPHASAEEQDAGAG